MNKDQVAGNWKQLKGKVKEQWGKLTDNDMTIVEGNMDQLAGRVQERYGIQRDEAERQIKEFRQRNEDLWP
ncbi:MAG TPA: CsbD family protein [Dongiaceae bacterium]|nr:CsbD family protein [Dongiaceae bacterium]